MYFKTALLSNRNIMIELSKHAKEDRNMTLGESHKFIKAIVLMNYLIVIVILNNCIFIL